MAPFSVLSKIVGLVNGKNGALSSKRQRRLAEVAERVRAKFLRQSIEDLEQRWLPVVNVSFNSASSLITITTGSNNDEVFITGNPTNFVISGTGYSANTITSATGSWSKITVTGQGSGASSFLTVNGTAPLTNPTGAANLTTFSASQFSQISIYQDITGTISGSNTNTVKVYPLLRFRMA